jgi:hypothetical protein
MAAAEDQKPALGRRAGGHVGAQLLDAGRLGVGRAGDRYVVPFVR